MKKLSYYAGNENYGEEYYPFHEFMPTGMTQEYDINLDRYENNSRDGKDFKDEIDELREKRKKRLRKLKLLKEMEREPKEEPNEENEPALEPQPFYTSLYGTPADFTGLNTSPLEYYNGTIIDGPDNLVNPYNNTYQMASNIRKNRMEIRALAIQRFEKLAIISHN